MDKYRKFLKRLSRNDRARVLRIVESIENDDLSSIKASKLKGQDNLFKARIGKIRVIFLKCKLENVIVCIDFRGDVYKKF